MNWTLFVSPALSVTAESEGVLISRRESTRLSSPSRLERVLPPLLMQFEDMEMGSAQSNSSWLVPYSQFVQLEANGIDAFENLCQWSPLALELESTQWLGSPDFRYTYRFHKGTSPISFERRGCFLATSADLFRLESDTFNLIEAIDAFNRSSSE